MENVATPDQKLAQLGIVLPSAASPIANYVPYVRTGNLLFISGQLPLQGGNIQPQHAGKLGREVTLEAGKEAARIAAINVLAQIHAALGSLDRVGRVVRLGGFINAAPGFTALAMCMNGASDFMVEVFGEKGRHARTTVGVAELPLDAAIEIEAVIEIEAATP
jgi:enamine deaminase RidA (YjgF/YER057c/UK114 family)